MSYMNLVNEVEKQRLQEIEDEASILHRVAIDKSNTTAIIARSHNRFIIISIVLLIVTAFIILEHTISQYNDKDIFSIHYLHNRSKIYLKSMTAGGSNSMYIRLNNNNVVLSEYIPWSQGSSFTVYTDSSNDQCFMLQSSTGKWLQVDYFNDNILSVSSTSISDASQFAAIRRDTVSSSSSGSKSPSRIHIKLCNQNNWLSISNKPVISSTSTTATKFMYYVNKISLATSSNSDAYSLFDLNSNMIPDNAAVFAIEYVQQIKGVNLGGWFIPEVWMCPSFYNGTGLGWGGSLCSMTNYSQPLAADRMIRQLETWITETDFQQISFLGYNSVRLPIGYWNVMYDPYHKFEPSDYKTSLKYIDFAFNMAAKYNLTVLLDMHGGPGSQNGIDHSGCGTDPKWINRYNVDLSLQAIDSMSNRYGNHPNLLGFELLNEPGESISRLNYTVLNTFYEKAYAIIRRNSKIDAYVIFNELYPWCYDHWNHALQEPMYYNVIIDWHLYEWPHASLDLKEHMLNALTWQDDIARYGIHHPILIGEWCMSTGIHQAGQMFVNQCIDSFQATVGWYLWNWKIERGIGFDEWDVQLQSTRINGLSPLHVLDIS